MEKDNFNYNIKSLQDSIDFLEQGNVYELSQEDWERAVKSNEDHIAAMVNKGLPSDKEAIKAVLLKNKKEQTIAELDKYYRTPEIEIIVVNGIDVKVNYSEVIEPLSIMYNISGIKSKLENDDSVKIELPMGNTWLPFSLLQVEKFLLFIAENWFHNQKTLYVNKQKINNFTTIEEVDNYDYKEGFLINKSINIT